MSKSYPGLGGEFLDWCKKTDRKVTVDSAHDYLEQHEMDEDQRSWLFGWCRRAWNEGYIQDFYGE